MLLSQVFHHETAVDLDPQLATVQTCLITPNTMQEMCVKLPCNIYYWKHKLAKASLLNAKQKKMLSSSCKEPSGDES